MGLGLGIALGAMLLQLIDFAMEQPVLVADGGKTYTQEQLDAAVDEAIRQLPPSSSSQAPTDEPGSPGDGAALKPPGSGTDGADPAGSGPAGTGPGTTDPGASTGPADGTTQERLIVAFYVNKNMDLRTVALSLKTLGVIDDADDFTQAARSISRKIEIGTAMFTGKPSYDEIIAELTRPKDD